MEISGKIITILPQASGEGRNGPWRSQDYVLETNEQYPKKVCFNLFGEKIDKFPLEMGDVVNVSFDIESREYNGKWYTTIRAWKVEKNVVNTPPALSENIETGYSNPLDAESPDTTDDLPF
ncbi:MAG: DUF3127 domain-containing protein [Paludibacteraceae bacterium]